MDHTNTSEHGNLVRKTCNVYLVTLTIGHCVERIAFRESFVIFPMPTPSMCPFIEMTAPSSATRDGAGVSKKPPRSNGSVLNFKSLKEV